MSKKIWIGTVIVVFVAVVTSLVLLRQGTTGPFSLGVIVPLTGEAAQYGKAFQEGALLAMKEINARNAREGRQPLVLRFEDSKADPKTAVSAFQKLTTVDKVRMVLGGMFSSTTLAMAPIAQRNGVVLLSPTAAAPEVPATGDRIFTIYPSASYDGRFLGNFIAKNMRISSVALLAVQADAMLTCKKEFKKQSQLFDRRIVLDESFPPGTDDFRTTILKLKAAHPDAVFVAAYLNEVAQLLVQARQVGFKTRFITISTAYDQSLFSLAGDAAEGLILSAPFFDARSTQEPTRTFTAAYERRYGTKPNVWAAYGYDVVRIAYAAIKQADQDDVPLNQALLSVSRVPSVTGFSSFQPDGSVEPVLRVFVVRNRAFQEFNSQ
ncbi:ABC transporter substrate-binding protein [bacterium]|nr:ABC transporter substrate-binding protein [bacterium]